MFFDTRVKVILFDNIYRNMLNLLIFATIFAFSSAQLDVYLGNSTEHFANCTINNVVYYDDDCTNFIKRLITWMGLGILLMLFLVCGCLWYCICFLCQVLFCNDRYNPRMFTRNYPNYSTIP